MEKEQLTLEKTIKKAALKGNLPELEAIISKRLAKFQGRGDTLTPGELFMQTIYLRTLVAICEYRDNSKLIPSEAEAPLTLLEK